MTTDYYTVFWARWNNFSTIGFYLNAKKFQTLPHITKWRHNFVKWRLIGISCRCSILEIWGIIYAKSHLNPSGAHFRMPCYVSFQRWYANTIRYIQLQKEAKKLEKAKKIVGIKLLGLSDFFTLAMTHAFARLSTKIRNILRWAVASETNGARSWGAEHWCQSVSPPASCCDAISLQQHHRS